MSGAKAEPPPRPHHDGEPAATSPAHRAAPVAIAPLALVCMALLYPAMAWAAFRGVPVALQTYAAAAGLAVALIALSAIDLREQRLPDLLTWPLLAAGLTLAAGSDTVALASHVLAAALGYGAFQLVARAHLAMRGTAGLGGGDAKLMAAGGAWIGVEALPTLVLMAAVTALLAIGAARIYGHRIDRDRRIPFGPFLALGIWYAWLFGPLLPS